jgi:hypothetical protein
MISFKMKILKYNQDDNSYLVEYIADNTACTPVKLSIYIDVADIDNMDEVLGVLKNSSPQEFWAGQLRKNNRVNTTALSKLVNTEHAVEGSAVVLPEGADPVLGRGSSTPSHFAGEPAPHQAGGARQNRVTGYTRGEQTASPDYIAAVRLRVAIQHVLQEMAEGTV